MSAANPATPRRFVWYDLMTTDTRAAQAFYESVVGWTAKDSGVPGQSYTIFSAGDAMVAGLMDVPTDARQGGVRPAWMGYVGVGDVDAWAERLQGRGGKVHRPPTEIPTVGRFAVVSDSQGAGFMLFAPLAGDMTPPPHPEESSQAGHVGWRELRALDGAKAFDWYAGLFGWTKGTAVDMGELGVYQLFQVAGQDVGGVVTKKESAPSWLFYFNVEAIDAAEARVKAAGGRVVGPPMEVPGGMWILNAFDPQGAEFALVAPKR
jgi:predicted enzyme related to lactoylglutathione lyase